MSGYGGCDDEALHAMVLVDNEVQRVLHQNALQSTMVGRTQCGECDQPIPPERLAIVPHAQYCIDCAPKYQQRPNVRILDRIL